MLVLTRKLNEEITIGDNIKVKVLQIKGNTIRLGIEAPRDVRIVRGELPTKQPTPTIDKEDADDTNMTVVFSNPREVKGTRVDVLPFERNSSKSRMTNQLEPNPVVAVSFQEQLPESLKRTRLQQIVDEITSK